MRAVSPLRGGAAFGLICASAWLLGGSLARFVRDRTTPDPRFPDGAASLVTDGPNAWTRNPMYVGTAGVLLTHSLLRRSWAATLPVALFVLVIDRSQIAAEERALAARFGEEYERYRAQVPRWIAVHGSPMAIGGGGRGGR